MEIEKRSDLDKAILVARSVHDRSDGPADGTAVILGALIRAVELLASAQKVRPQSPANSCTDAERQQYEITIRQKNERIEKLTLQRDEEHGLSHLRAIEIDTWKKELVEAREDVRRLRIDLAEANDRVKELEKYVNSDAFIDWEGQAKANMRLVGEKDEHIEKFQAYLKKLTAHLTPIDVDGRTPGGVNYETFRAAVMAQHASDPMPKWELAAQAVLHAFGDGMHSPPVDCDGKTPGQVHIEAAEAMHAQDIGYARETPLWEQMSAKERAREEAGARAVLRAFGGNALAKLDDPQSLPDTSTESGLPDPVLAMRKGES